jgi:leucyl-tRNA synthetase
MLLRILAPVVPHISHVLWRQLGFGDDVLMTQWPEHDPEALRLDSVELVVQVNGKLRARVSVPTAASQDEIQQLAMTDENVQRFITGKTVRKVIVVPGKLVNIVAA